MDIGVLGPLRVRAATGPLEVAGVKERTLLARLVAARGSMVRSAELVDALWPDDPPRTALKSLQTYVLRLRNALEPDRHGPPSLLLTDGPGYRLAVPPEAVDAERFTRLAALGRRALADGRPHEASSAFAAALELWRGPAYAGFEGTAFGSAEARRLDELRLAVQEDACAALLAGGQPGEAVPELERLVGVHPYRERLWTLLVHALYASGRQADALAAFARARAVLCDELGLDPGPELAAMHDRVLAQDPALVTVHQRPALPPELSATGPVVGREDELARLAAAWAGARAGSAVTVVLRGPPGAGAARLAAALASDVARTGAPVRHAGRDAAVVEAGPGLLVVDGGPAPQACPGRLDLLLAGPADPPPAHAEVIDLRPLAEPDVRAIVAGYVAREHLDGATADVLAESGGWPGPVHEAALRWARRRVSAQVGRAAAEAGRSAVRLAEARDEVRTGVVQLTETATGATRPDPSRCPWRGLAVYDVDDAADFAGRERLVAELVSRIAGGRLLAVVGASGSGKSSLVRAGLLGALADGVLPGSAGWSRVVLRPGEHPMRELARQALSAAGRQEDVGGLLEQLVREDSPEILDQRVVLVVDQLEEAWTACADVGERTAFLDALAELASDPRSPVTVVLAVRADWVGGLAEHRSLAARIADATVLVGSPTPPEVRRAVEQPAARAGLVLDVGLADAVVADAGCEPGLLPLLSTALTRLWERRDGGRLTLAAYVSGGGLSGAIAGLADDAFTDLPEPEQRAARVLLLRLAGPGEGSSVTRRRVPLAELDALPDPRVRDVVEPLVAARLLTVSDGHVEVAHEALFREWPRLRSWLEEDAAGRAVQLRLAQAATEWEREGREPALLWRGARLAAGLDAAHERPQEVTQVEAAFLHAGREAAEADRRAAEERAAATARANRRLRGLLAGTGVLLVVSLVAGLLAQQARRTAEAAGSSAEARRLAATAVNEDYLDLALLSAVEAVRAERSPETYGPLLTLLTRVPDVLTQVRADAPVLAGGVSPDGGTVYLGDAEGTVLAVDGATGRQRWRSAVPPGVIRSVDVDEAGRLLVTVVGDEAFLLVLDPVTGEERWRLGPDELPAGRSPRLAPDASWTTGGRVITATEDDLLLVDGDSGDVLSSRELPVPGMPDFLRAWPDGRVSFVQRDQDPVVVPVDDAAAPPRTLPAVVHAVSPDARLLAVVDDLVLPEVQLRLVDAVTLQQAADPVRLPGFHGAVAWSPDGERLAFGAGQELALLDGRTGALQRSFEGHSGAVMDVVFAGEDRATAWTAGRDGTAFAWDLTGRRGTLRSGTAEVAGYVGSSSADGTVAVVTQFHELRLNDAHLVDPRSGQRRGAGPLPVPEGCACQAWAVAMAPDGRTAYAVMEEWGGSVEQPELPVREDLGHLVAWDTRTGELRGHLELPWPGYGLDVTPDGRRAVAAGAGGIAVVDLPTLTVLARTEDDHPMGRSMIPGTVEVSPDGQVAAVGRAADMDKPGHLLLVDTRTAATVAERAVPEDDVMLSGTWSADGRTLVIGGFRGHVRFFARDDLSVTAPPRLVTGGHVLDLATSPDGRFLASLGTDGDVLLWDAEQARPIGTPVTDGLGWGWVHFDADGKALRMLGMDGDPAPTVTVDVDPDEWLRDACRIAGRELTADEWAVARPGVAQRPTCADLR